MKLVKSAAFGGNTGKSLYGFSRSNFFGCTFYAGIQSEGEITKIYARFLNGCGLYALLIFVNPLSFEQCFDISAGKKSKRFHTGTFRRWSVLTIEKLLLVHDFSKPQVLHLKLKKILTAAFGSKLHLRLFAREKADRIKE